VQTVPNRPARGIARVRKRRYEATEHHRANLDFCVAHIEPESHRADRLFS